MFSIVNKTSSILREKNICDSFEYVFEEKEKRYLHVWILPRYNWMNDICEDIIDNIGLIFNYAKNNFRDNNNYEEIKKITEVVKEEFYK